MGKSGGDGYAPCHWTLHFKTVEMVNLPLCVPPVSAFPTANHSFFLRHFIFFSAPALGENRSHTSLWELLVCFFGSPGRLAWFSSSQQFGQQPSILTHLCGLLFKSWLSASRSEVKVPQSCPTLCDPMGYTVHGILQARTVEWVAFPSSRGSSQPRERTEVSRIAGGSFTSWATGLPPTTATSDAPN